MMVRTGGWLFDGVAGSDGGYGPQVTLTGGIALADENDCVRQSVVLLISTIPGERVMRPDYGCPLHRLVFNSNDDTTAGLAVHYVRQALTQFEPRVEILRLEAGNGDAMAHHDGAEDGGDSRLNIELEYRVRATQRNATLTIGLNLNGDRV